MMRLDALKQEQEFAMKIKKNKKETLDFRHQCQMNMLYVSKKVFRACLPNKNK